MKRVLHIFIWINLSSLLIYANEYAVITNKNFGAISKNQLRAIYLKKISYINDVKLLPINLEPKSKIRQSFNKNILNMSYTRLKVYWNKEHYLGHRPPLSLKSQESVKVFLKKVDGAIGYIEAKNIDENMHIILRWRD